MDVDDDSSLFEDRAKALETVHYIKEYKHHENYEAAAIDGLQSNYLLQGEEVEALRSRMDKLLHYQKRGGLNLGFRILYHVYLQHATVLHQETPTSMSLWQVKTFKGIAHSMLWLTDALKAKNVMLSVTFLKLWRLHIIDDYYRVRDVKWDGEFGCQNMEL
ncbi:hypothetical protein Tco_0954515 [Tanacetum coccineum]|uniref:Uncharacterized protein n=1 Tax=Tanacetum coccineum TaxID=301880 RepID=A0ABQ5E4L3_9ASTR